jgi:hypothetical protein
MAKRKSNKKAGKEVSKKTRAKGAAKSAAKKPTAHKPADDKDKAINEIPSDIEHPLEQTDRTQTDKPADGSKEVDVGKSHTETPTGKEEDSQKDDQARGVTEAILEAVSEEERPADEVGNLQTEEQTGSATGAVIEGPDAEGSLTENAGDTQADKPVDDAPESLVESSVTTESTTEEIDAFQTDKPTEADVESSDTEIHVGKVEVSQTDDQTDEITEAILEAAAEAERLAEETESLQTEDEQTSIVVDAEDSDSAESLSSETENTQTGKLTDGVSESVVEDSVAVESSTEKIDDNGTNDRPEDVNEALIEDADTLGNRIEKADDTQTDSQAGEVIEVAAETERPAVEAESLQTEDEQAGIVVDAEDSDSAEILSQKTEDAQTGKLTDDVSESVVEDSVAAESQTVVDRIKKLFSGIFRIGSKTDDSAEEGIESPETVANHAGKTDDTRTDNQAVFPTEANVEGSDNEIQTAVYSDIKPYLTKKTGIIISVFIIIAAVILLIVASIERRSAKKALVQFSKVAESIKQMQEETLKDREQVTHSQIESRELVIDTLSLTRNGLELERANTDEVEVKRIIGVFINDIDERITKIKGDIALLRNKLKETD